VSISAIALAASSVMRSPFVVTLGKCADPSEWQKQGKLLFTLSSAASVRGARLAEARAGCRPSRAGSTMSGRNSVSRSARPRQVYLLGCGELLADVDSPLSGRRFYRGDRALVLSSAAIDRMEGLACELIADGAEIRRP
jgi:hypothetical protein